MSPGKQETDTVTVQTINLYDPCDFHYLNLEKLVECEKDVQAIDLVSVMKKCVVFAMDGEYAGIAGANPCHLIGEEHFFHSVIELRDCTDFRNPTDLSRFNCH